MILNTLIVTIGEDYCVSETFQPRCVKNEIVFIKSAIYGRMRIGRCITAAEIETLRSHYIGCSTSVRSLIDRKCFGKTECEIRIAEISVENIRPCPPGLNVYLEVSYDCIDSKSSKNYERTSSLKCL